MWIVAAVMMAALVVEIAGMTWGALPRWRPRRGGDRHSDDPGP
jgi:hypothetical protein